MKREIRIVVSPDDPVASVIGAVGRHLLSGCRIGRRPEGIEILGVDQYFTGNLFMVIGKAVVTGQAIETTWVLDLPVHFWKEP